MVPHRRCASGRSLARRSSTSLRSRRLSRVFIFGFLFYKVHIDASAFLQPARIGICMATGVLIESRSRARLPRVIAWVAGVLALLTLAVLGWLYSIARSALPQLDGKLQVPGLAASVTVFRDDHGIPTIDAANFDDLFF